MIRLSRETLGALPAGVAAPAYDRARVSPGILHVGLGNFHRAHLAIYLDDLFAMGKSMDWGIVGAGVRPADGAMRERLEAQDWLSTVVELEPGALRARVCGVLTGFAPVAPANGPLIAAMCDPAIRIVSLTVTEGGYFLDSATGDFDANHPQILADAANPDAPGTVFGAMLAALRRRRAASIPPFTVMSCDNIPGNGHVAMAALIGLARLHDKAFADWVAEHVAAPDGMVDRIAVVTDDARRAVLRDDFGLEDASPVFCEPFRQWVLEDHFPTGRPEFEAVGVTFTPDVAAYERMKLRILNGGHACIAYPGALLDCHFAHDAMAHPLVAGFLDKVETEEIVPMVPPPPGQDLWDYLALIKSRFANPEVKDTIARLCLDGSNRQPKFILPSTRDRVAQGAPVTGLALESALWCRYLAGGSETGREYVLEDEQADRLRAAALAAKADPAAFIGQRDIFGDLADAPAFSTAFGRALGMLWSEGTAATLQRYLALEPGAALA
ncbi:MAG: mannitol dehydrogenase family protein [Pseudomonadota bacterium]|nr:mannitol dehydrogenase family protein [Pseudomonadota bacterium]